MIALTDGTGAIEERYAYSAYGEPVFVSATGTVLTDSAKDNRYTYTGREWDGDLSLYHFRARMYDAASGRFCGKDPIGFLGSAFGLFEFLESAPLVNSDPFGLMCMNDAVDGNEEGEEDGMAIDALIWVLEQGCLAQCYLLDMRDEEIVELLEGLVEDAPEEVKKLFKEWILGQPTKALLALIGISKGGIAKINIIQGTGIPGQVLRWLLGNFQIKLRRKLASISLKLVDKGGKKVFTRLGTKAIPAVGWALLAKEGCDLGFCRWACKDGKYTAADTWGAFAQDAIEEKRRLERFRCECERGRGWAPWYPK